MRLYVVLAALVLASALAVAGEPGPTRFVVFGDLQDPSEKGRAADRALVARINGLAPDFSVFVGDIQGGDQPCTDAMTAGMAAVFAGHEPPLVYTPGDNEWTDCWRERAGGADPIERQAAVIEAFTAPGRSIGRNRMALAQQSGRRENARWQSGGVVFATLHLTGSNNNLRQDEEAIAEHLARDADNLAWMAGTFALAQREQAAAVALFIHANPQWDAPWWSPTGFDRFRAALARHALEFDRPIMVAHGDTHTMRIDYPFKAAANVMRVEVFGPPVRGAILIEADAEAPGVFRMMPLPHRFGAR